MSAIFSTISSIWTAYGPWIGAALIPTIISGLSLSPVTAAEASVVQKVWDAVKQIMSVFSVATFKDAPGTFQLPLKLGSVVKKPNVPTALLVIFFAFGSIRCAWLKSEATDVGQVALACSGSSAISTITDIGNIIVAALPSPTFAKVIEGMIVEFGEDLVGCAALQVQNNQIAQAKALKTDGSAKTGLTPDEVTKLNNLITNKKWVVRE